MNPTLNDPDSPQAEADWQWYCWHYANRHCARSISKWEAMELFRAELPELALTKIAANEQPDHFKSILQTLRKWASGDKTELNIAKAKAYPLEDIFRQYGLESRHGAIRCPFHKDDTPSLSVDRKTNRWKCWGCGESGDSIDFIMKKEGLNFVEAIKRLTT